MLSHDQDIIFSAAERRSLAQIVALIIPPDEDLGLPGADDPLIFDDILRDAARRYSSLAPLLAEFGPQSDADGLRRKHPQATGQLQQVVMFCYYRDPRVMRALDMEVRPPFPKGFDLEQSDLSLLEPVRRRGSIYRKA